MSPQVVLDKFSSLYNSRNPAFIFLKLLILLEKQILPQKMGKLRCYSLSLSYDKGQVLSWDIGLEENKERLRMWLLREKWATEKDEKRATELEVGSLKGRFLVKKENIITRFKNWTHETEQSVTLEQQAWQWVGSALTGCSHALPYTGFFVTGRKLEAEKTYFLFNWNH